MEKMFGGMKEHFISNTVHYKDKKAAEAWVTNYISQRLKMHQGMLTMIVRAILRSDINQNNDSIRNTVKSI